MVEVIGTEEFEAWFLALEQGHATAVARVVDQLEERGVSLPFPLSSAIVGAKYALRELRIQSQGRPLRVFYIFDKERQAVLLIGGDKTGDGRFYETMTRLSEKIWEAYAKERGFTP